MSDDSDPVARARALAARLSQKLGGGGAVGGFASPPVPVSAAAPPQHAYGAQHPSPLYASHSTDSVLGKRSYRDDGDSSSGGGGGKRTKVPVPSSYPDILLLSAQLRGIEGESRARLSLRGRGAPHGGEGDESSENEELHVLVQGDSEESMQLALKRLYDHFELAAGGSASAASKQSQALVAADHFVSPLAKDTPNATFALSSALYANDEGFQMFGPPRHQREPEERPRGPPPREGETTREIQVEREHVGLVIGRAGAMIQSIQSNTGTYIQVLRDQPGQEHTPMRTLSIRGAPHQIDAAEAEIRRVLASGPGGGGGGSSSSSAARPGLGYDGGPGSEMIQVPQVCISLVIGRGGETINSMQARSGARIHVQREEGGPNPSGMRDVKLVGPPEAIAAARHMIEELVRSSREMGGSGIGGLRHGGGGGGPPGHYGGPPSGPPPPPPPGVPGMDPGQGPYGGAPYGGGPPGGDGYRGGGGPPLGQGYRGGPPVSGPGLTTIYVPVPAHAVAAVIGGGGQVVKALQRVSGARIVVGQDTGSDMRDIVVSGRPDQCETAKREIEQVVSMRAQGMAIDPRMIGSSAGYSGGYGPPGGQGGYGAGGGYGAPYDSYGGPPPAAHGGYGGGGYGAPPSAGGYGVAPPAGPPGAQQPYGAPGYDPYGAAPSSAPPASAAAPADSAPVSAPSGAAPAGGEVEAPVPPTDPAAFEGWWGTLTLPQQQAYYRKHYPEMLSQLTAQQ